MKIQISNKRIIKDAIVVWDQPGPEIDIVMDLRNLTFRPGTVTEIYAFHILENLSKNEIEVALKNWFNCLCNGGKLHVINDDFEYVSRAFVGGDIDIDLFNNLHNHLSQITRDSLLNILIKSGFLENNISVWIQGNPEGIVDRKHYEFILTGTKHG